jgi:hypothetical protein
MANNELLKASIRSAIKANGNEEITGDILQQTLVAIVDALGKGYQFMGAAIPGTVPGIPDQKVCYLAMEKGVYPNFNALEVGEHEIAIMMYDSRWWGITIPSNVPDVNAVSYLKQWHSNDEKAQARNNIGIPDYATFDIVGQLAVNLGDVVKYVDAFGTIYNDEPGAIIVNSNILEIDFCGATLETRYGIKGHARCKIKNLTIKMTANNTAIEGFGYVENVYVTAVSTPHVVIPYGFRNCDHLYNCKCDGNDRSNDKSGADTGFSYCNYLFQCRYSGWPTEVHCIGFEHCNFISQCYMKYGYSNLTFKYSLGTNRHVESLIGISYSGETPVFETFADTSHIRIGDYNLDNFIKLISSSGGTGKTKLYAKPDDKPGMATVLMDTSVVNLAVARRTATGTLKARDASDEDDVVTLKQLNAAVNELKALIAQMG